MQSLDSRRTFQLDILIKQLNLLVFESCRWTLNFKNKNLNETEWADEESL